MSDPHDPLVTPAQAGIGGWFRRITAMFQRSWKSMGAIFLLMHVIPSMALAIVLALGSELILRPWQERILAASAAGEVPSLALDADLLPGFAMTYGLLLLISLVLASIGYAASTYAVTREAAGLTVSFGAAVEYGVRRCLGLFGWNLLVTLMTVVAAVFFLLPGAYVALGTALVGPVYLFERRNPLDRSFTMLHRNVERILGRLAMTAVIVIGGSGAVSTAESVLTYAVRAADADVTLVGSAAVAAVGALLQLPISVFLFVAILLTYAEQRGYEAPVSTGSLAAELTCSR